MTLRLAAPVLLALAASGCAHAPPSTPSAGAVPARRAPFLLPVDPRPEQTARRSEADLVRARGLLQPPLTSERAEEALALLTAACGRGHGPACVELDREPATRPEPLGSRPRPRYTREALQARVEGLLVIRCRITRSGQVAQCHSLKDLPHMSAEALASLAAGRYTPVTWRGVPVEAEYVFNIRLAMPGGSPRSGAYPAVVPEMLAQARLLAARHPASGRAWSHLAWVQRELGQPLEERLATLRQALTVAPDDGALLDALADVHLRQGDVAAALEAATRAALEERSSHTFRGTYARALSLAARCPEARAVLEELHARLDAEQWRGLAEDRLEVASRCLEAVPPR
jgi:hypothetical protein